eukprot:5898931-Amphidinium_carterae.1
MALLQQYVRQEEAHLMVMGSNGRKGVFGERVNRDVELINAVADHSNWRVAHAGNGYECASEPGRVVQRTLGGAGFDAGPA